MLYSHLHIFFALILLHYYYFSGNFAHLLAVPKCPDKCQCSIGDGKSGTGRFRVDCRGLSPSDVPSVLREMDPSVEHLDMRNCGLACIDVAGLIRLGKLRTLMLGHNRIRHLEENLLDRLPNLLHLHLGHNQIRSVPPLASSTASVRLQLLDLRANKIRHISPMALQNLPHLHSLNLEANFLQSLPEALFHDGTHRLRQLHLASNSWNCDCRIGHLIEQITEKTATKNHFGHHHHQHHHHHHPKCFFPVHLRGKALNSLETEALKCFQAEVAQIDKNGAEILLKCDIGTLDIHQNADTVQWLYGNTLLEDISMKFGGFELLSNGMLRLLDDGSDHGEIGNYQCALNHLLSPTRHSRHIEQQRHNQAIKAIFSPPTIADQQQLTAAHSSLSRRQNAVASPDRHHDHFHRQHRLHHNQQQRHHSRHQAPSNLYTASGGALAGGGGSVPQFTYAPRDRRFREGSAVQLNCEAIGQPKPSISWFFNGRPIEPSRKFEFKKEHTELVIYPFLEHDVGSYACEATNLNGRVKSEAAQIGLVGPRRQTARPGQRLTLSCKARGEPKPTITWFFNGVEIADLKGHFQVSADGTELTINGVTRHDTGTFACMAGNVVGSQTADAQLDVQSAQIDQLDTTLNDQTLRSIVDEASQNIDRAISKTNEELKISNPQDLLKHFKFVGKRPTSQLSRAREIYEESLRLIEKHVELGINLRPLDMPNEHISFESVLSVTHIQTLMELSGCMAGQFKDACQDMCFHSKYRSYTGQCNNFEHPTWGVSQMPFLRLLPPIYENGFNTPVGWDTNKRYFGFPKPNPRTISFELVSTEQVTAHSMFSAMLMQWGQFVDHDLDFIATALSRQTYTGGARCNRTCENVDPCFNIQLPPNDPRLRTMGHNRLPCIEFERSAAICGSGETSPIFKQVTFREQANIITSYLDGSQIYGSTEVDALDLRDLFSDHGLLRFDIVSSAQKPYLPFERDSAMDCRRNFSVENPIRCFLSGDFRANEQLGLTAMHTIWLREHNRIATKLLELNPDWDGERIYQEARKIVGAMLQHITYTEWLPLVLGKDGYNFLIGTYTGYRPDINPSVSNAFATAAFRFGHTLISPQLERLDKALRPTPEGPLPLHEAFFAPERLLAEGGVDPLLRGLFGTPLKMPMSDQLLNKELTEKLFHRAHNVSLDLAALNIQRGRDHGIPGYLEYRRFCNLTVPSDWDQLAVDVPNSKVLAHLRKLYGHPGNIDLWLGGIVEKRLPDALIGPTFSCIIGDQFRRLRDGDRFWYENDGVFTQLQLAQIRKTSLAKVLCTNGDDIDRIQPNVFRYMGNNMLAYRSCDELAELNLRMWMSCCDETCSARASTGIDSANGGNEQSRRRKRAVHLYANGNN
ncbi:hypothetical protein niasHS_000010 [Heterodera schachtii]|uniref:Ig-like domain-containing protein n=2 Tax=Heterodera TaxID=34509 RepID=A0ABD2K6E8_HETSC